MRRKFRLASISAMLVAAVSVAFAGGFALEIGKPSANPEAQAKHAIFQLRGVGCVSQDKVTFTASAAGFVNGKREDIPLKLIPLSTPGLYALTRQWPTEGTWVITVIASYPKFNVQPSAIVKLDGDWVDWAGITRLAQAPTRQEVDKALSSTTTAKLRRQ